MKIFCAVVVIGLFSLCSAAPKIGTSTWDNLLQVGGNIDVTKTPSTGRSSDVLLEDFIENYFKSHEVVFDLPGGSTVALGARNLDNEELNFKLKFDSGSQVQARKKSKIKKIFVPILVFILIKAMTLIPIALAVLGLKTWNALQLSFISFVTTVAMAVWKLCTKVNGDHPHPHVIHEDYDPHHHHYAAARSDQVEGLQMAYNGYNQPQN